MKVLQFMPSLGVNDGGTTTYMQQLTACLGQMCELHVCALTSVDQFVPLEHCYTHSIPNEIRHLSVMKKAWVELLTDICPDVVHVNCCWLPQIAMIIQWTKDWRKSRQNFKCDCHVSIVLTPHGMLEPWILKRNYWTRKLPAILLYQRRAVKQCDLLIATAEEERNHILQLGWNQKVALVRNGIDVERIVPKTEYKAPKELLFLSRIHPKKGLDLLIGALADFLPNSPFHLTIAGTGEDSYVGQLKEKVHALGLDASVTFVGPVYGDRKWQLLRDTDVVVLPTYSENYGLIVAEALASGTPVITTTGTPWRSLVENACGWWVEPDQKSIENVLWNLSLKSAEELKKMGERARRVAEMDCAISKKVHELYQLYLTKCI